MLKTLELRNCFTHKHLDIDFQKGLTGILGPNGSGKSLILEMVQYALWGSAALRGKAEDYKGLQVTLTFEVKGTTYQVKRSGSTVRLTSNGADLATGIKAVNPYIQHLFGYGYNVFTMANAVNQGKIEELGDMLPTARKKLVDQTIGLDRLDGLGEWVATQAKDLRAEIAASEKYLVAPTEPTPPPGQQKEASVLLTELQALQADLTRKAMWRGMADAEIIEPPKVKPHKRLGELESLEGTQGIRQALTAQQASISQALEGFPALEQAPEPHPAQSTRESLVAVTKQFMDLTAQKTQAGGLLKGLPEAKYTQAEVEAQEALQVMANRWVKKQLLLKELAEYVCPKCAHHWHDEDPRLKDYADVLQEVEAPTLVGKALTAAKNALATADTRQGLVEALALLEERLQGKRDWTVTIKEIDAAVQAQTLYQERLQQEGRRLDLVAQLEAIVLPENNSALIAELKANQRILTAYAQLLQTYTEKLEAKRHATEQYNSFPSDLDVQVVGVQAQWQARGIYEAEVAAYLTAQARYEALLAEVNVSRETLKQWVLCGQAIATLRQRVKGYLLPSLNKVASHLLQTMTAGVLTWIVVSEDFDITVDGQRLETLSGAGKSVANLALRIGLGQVLTNRTFSVLMLDEIDASCDDARANAIAESLQRLTGQIQQIIQVSHKSGLVADNYLRLDL